MSFKFRGVIPASKSSFNRALIIKSFNKSIELKGEAECDDIQKMKAAISNLIHNQTEFDCGEAGTVLRFLALRVSREKGTFKLTGKSRLFKRPQKELQLILNQLGVESSFTEDAMLITSSGWQIPSTPLKVSAKDSSQFLSGVVLSSWNLPQKLQIEISSQEMVSESYFNLTLKLMKSFGYHSDVNLEKKIIVIEPHQVPETLSFQVESDLSSAFAVAALAAIDGSACLESFPFDSSQPDLVFIELLKNMGVECEKMGSNLVIKKPLSSLKSISVNLKESPDLFPVLCAIASSANGCSHFYGAPHLRFKESDRIAEVIKILTPLGIHCEALEDGAKINITPPSKINLTNPIILDAKDDHRLVMMGAVLKSLGHKIQIINTHSVNKSFPEFLKIAAEFL